MRKLVVAPTLQRGANAACTLVAVEPAAKDTARCCSMKSVFVAQGANVVIGTFHPA